MNMPDPKCKEDVQRALGIVNYLSKFVPNMSVKTTALLNCCWIHQCGCGMMRKHKNEII